MSINTYGLTDLDKFNLRHSDAARAELGVWRWAGMQEYQAEILSEIAGKRVIDFGGAAGPLGFDSVIVDKATPDKWTTLNEWREYLGNFGVDVIFTSHTLEHIEDLTGTLDQMRAIAPTIICHVPSWKNPAWRAGVDRPRKEQDGPHLWTFGLWEDKRTDVMCIDRLIQGRWPRTKLATHCGDLSILVIATEGTDETETD